MARFGRLPVDIPEATEVKTQDGKVVVKGPKGTLQRDLPREVKVEVKDGQVLVGKINDSKMAKALQGTYRSHIVNMITGVTEGFIRELEMVGAGYRATLKGKDLELTVGLSHPVLIKASDEVTFGVEKNDIKIEGINLEEVSHMAAKIRAVRPPEPYKGKGIKYKDEEVRRKAGKQAAKAE